MAVALRPDLSNLAVQRMMKEVHTTGTALVRGAS
jgi:hypothetical protein